MRVDDFDFELPDRLIALRPAVPRDSARLLVVRENGGLEHWFVRDLPGLLHPADVMVVNDSKVIAARLHGVRESRGSEGAGAKCELLVFRRVNATTFRAFARPAKRLRPGDRVRFGRELHGTVMNRDGAEVAVTFSLAGEALDAAIAELGEIPLPPYITGKRPSDLRDRSDYQTVYARTPGSVAAPTAGLHFTPELLQALRERGIETASVTLHVGPGTFLPVSTEDSSAHVMHSEWAWLSESTAAQLNAARRAGGRIVAAGTTALRTLETAAGENGAIAPFAGETALFITPGYRFKAVNVLLTNFHLPKSTLFMLVSAFSGTETMKRAYGEAIEAAYRFYSYGDACLLFRSATA